MSFPTFDLNLLLALNAVLTEGSVVKAANRLHVTPSAISNAVYNAIGVRLRSVPFTPLKVRAAIEHTDKA